MATEWLRLSVQSWTRVTGIGRTPPEGNISEGVFEPMSWQPFRGLWQGFESTLAEREGFEPSEPRKGFNGFRDRPIQPLSHLSAGVSNIMGDNAQPAIHEGPTRNGAVSSGPRRSAASSGLTSFAVPTST